MPRNPANDITAVGQTRIKVTAAAGPADTFRSVGVVSPAGVLQLVGNQGTDVSRIYGDGSKWMPILPAVPGTLVAGQFFIQTLTGVDRLGYVDSLATAQYLANAGVVTASGLTMNTGFLLGRSTAGVGAVEEITVGAGLQLLAGVLSTTGAGTGTVTSVALALPSIFTVSGSPVTTTGTLTGTLATQTANLVFAGPASGAAAIPTFRSTVPLDIAATPAASQFLQASSGVTMAWQTMGGDALLTAGGVLTLNSLLAPGGPIGSASTVPVITYDTKGRLTVVTTATITAAAIGAAASGLITTSGLTMSTSMLLGRSTAGTGAVEEITVGTGLLLSAGVLTSTTSGGTVTGTGAATQLAVWTSASAITGDSGLTYVLATNTLSTDVYLASNGTLANAAFAFTSDPNTGINRQSAGVLEFVAGGTSIMTASTTTVTINGKLTVTGLIDPTGLQLTQVAANPGTADTIWVSSANSSWTVHRRFQFTASTTAGASANLTPGVAPTSPVDGDIWMTTSGFFTRINGVTAQAPIAGPVTTSGLTMSTARLLGRSTASTGAVEEIIIGSGLTLFAGTLTASGSGTVTSVALSLPSIFSVSGSPVTTTGTLTGTLATQTANLVFAGPGSGAAAAPTFRTLVPLDLTATPASGQLLQATSGVAMAWNTLSGDATISNAGVLTLSSTITAGGPTGSSSVVPVITYDAKGRLTTVTTATITPAAIGAALSGAVTASGLTMATARLLGRSTAATGAIEEITVGSGLTLSAGTLTATGGGGTVTGTGVANQVMYWSSTSAAAGDTGMVYDATNDQLALAAGTAALPSYAIIGDLNTGMYGVGADNLGFTTLGTLRLDISTTALTTTLPISAPNGATPTTPPYTFSGDTDTGMYRGGANILAFATNGSQRLSISTTAILPQIPITAQSGAAATPSYTFNGDLDTGMWSSGADALDFTVGGSNFLRGTTTAVFFGFVTNNVDGAVSAPSVSFTNDPDTGLYRIGTNSMGVAANGALQLSISEVLTTSNNPLVLTPHVTSGAPTSAFRINVGNNTAMTASTEYLAVILSAGPTLQFATGALTTQRYVYIDRPTYTAVGASVITDAATVAITGAPSASTNITITNAYALWVQAGVSGFAAATTSNASIRLPHGVAPTSPTNGDMWTTTAGLFARINGSTVGPYAPGGTVSLSDGSAGSPSLFFTNSPTTGFFRAGADDLAISIAGSSLVDISSTGMVVNGDVLLQNGSFKMNSAGQGLFIKEGTDATSGVATLVAGTVVVSTTKVTANSRIQLTGQNLGTITVPVGLYVSARTAGTSFTILSGNAVDTSDIAWVIIEPA